MKLRIRVNAIVSGVADNGVDHFFVAEFAPVVLTRQEVLSITNNLSNSHEIELELNEGNNGR